MSAERKTNAAEPEPEIRKAVSINRLNSAADAEEEKKSCCAPLFACYNAFTKTRVGSALSREYSFFFNFVFAQILWWAIAFPKLVDNGYENDISNGDKPWGSQGSGVVPVAVTLAIIATALFLYRFISNLIEGVPLTAAELITQQITRRNTTSKKKEKQIPTVIP